MSRRIYAHYVGRGLRMSEIAAVLVSDLHFSEKAPVARSAEPDWFAAQERQWVQLRDFANRHEVPIVIAGDVFDVWRASPATINFALGMMLGYRWGIYAVPGQHDLPNHSYDEIKRSAYWTLVEAGVMENLYPGRPVVAQNYKVAMHGIPWGFDIEPCQRDRYAVNLAVVHRYIWVTGKGYLDAPSESHYRVTRDLLTGYDVAVFGDNHKGFLTTPLKGCRVLNCGGFMARKSDERNAKPSFGCLYDDGKVERVSFDISEDKWIDSDGPAVDLGLQIDIGSLASELAALEGDTLDFVDLLTHYLDDQNVDQDVRRLVVQALDKGRENGV